MRRSLSILMAAGLLLSACESAEMNGAPLNVSNTTTTGPVEHETVELPPTSAYTKRLSVDMIQDSLPIVGGSAASWRVNYLNKEYDGFTVLGPTLGRPDYVSLTVENLEPTALYVKFMGDMAVHVCDKIIASDKKEPTISARVLMRFIESDDPAAGVNANLRYLKLRFLAERVQDDDTEGIADLRAVYDAALNDPNNKDDAVFKAWNAVCVALFTSPSFHLY